MYYLRAKNTQPAFPVSLNRIKYSTYSSLKITAMQSRQSANLIRKDKSSNEITVQGCIHAITGNFQVRTMMQREWRPFSKNALRISLTWLKKVSRAWSDSHLTWFLFGTLKDLVGVLMLANVELSYSEIILSHACDKTEKDVSLFLHQAQDLPSFLMFL